MSAIINGIWWAWLILWLVLARRVKRTESQQSLSSRWVHIACLAVGANLAFFQWPPLGPLDGPFTKSSGAISSGMASSSALEWIGLAVTVLGMAFAIGARFYLGANWSGRITLKADHELIQTGPYSLVRHPIYSGLLLAMLGSCLVYDRWRCLIGLAVFFVAFNRKAKREEKTLTSHFGQSYVDYERRVKRLVPYLW